MINYPRISLIEAQTEMLLRNEPHKGSNSRLPVSSSFDPEITSVIESLKAEIHNLIPLNSVKSSHDAVLRPLVHSKLKLLPPEALQDNDFWRYLSTCEFHELVKARHPLTDKSKGDQDFPKNWENYGAFRVNITESLMYRLFIGASLAIDPLTPADPYNLCRVHDVDLWQSHIIRVKSGDNPAYSRELLRWFKNRDAWYKHRSRRDFAKKMFGVFDKNPQTLHLRDLVKRVRVIRSNVIHEFLSEAEIRVLIEREAEKSLLSIEDWGEKKPSKAKAKRRKRNTSSSKQGSRKSK